MKDTFYFSHDYNTRQDIKIRKLLFKHGYLGYGLFWAIIEDLYNNANALPTEYESIAFELRVDVEVLKSVILDFGLFVISKETFGSVSIEKRLDERNLKTKKAKQSAFARWDKVRKDAELMRLHEERIAKKDINDTKDINESIKSKEINPQTSTEVLPQTNLEDNLLPLEVKKENTLTLGGGAKKNDVDNRKLKFRDSLIPYVVQYGKEMITDFYNYWTETSKNGLSFRMESEKFFDVKKRLVTWQKRNTNFNKTEKKTKLENNLDALQESLNMTPNNNNSYELPN